MKMLKVLRDRIAKRTNSYEKADPKPLGIPMGFERPPTLQEQVRRLVQSERLRQEAMELGYETEEEANDFNIEDQDPFSPHELVFDDELQVEISRRDKAILDDQRRVFDAKVAPEIKKAQAAKSKKQEKDEFQEETPKKPDPK